MVDLAAGHDQHVAGIDLDAVARARRSAATASRSGGMPFAGV